MDPSYIDAYNLLARLFIQQKRLDEALAEYTRIAEQRPNDVGAHTMVALIYQVQQKDAEAKKTYEKILSIDSRAVLAANNLAYIHAEEGGNLETALNLAQAAKAASPEHPDVNDTLGWVYYKRNLPSLAVGPLEQSVKADPRNPTYQYHLGLVYTKLGEKGKARAALERVLTLQPNFEQANEVRKALAELQD
jgi:tetratricopeptide (TPR) repeat protein